MILKLSQEISDNLVIVILKLSHKQADSKVVLYPPTVYIGYCLFEQVEIQ